VLAALELREQVGPMLPGPTIAATAFRCAMVFTFPARIRHTQPMRAAERNEDGVTAARLAAALTAFEPGDEALGVSELARRLRSPSPVFTGWSATS
jgi:hypothetical protein